MKKTYNLSPNFSKRQRNFKEINFIIFHYTGMQSEIESIKRLKSTKAKVSCHYLINRSGNIIQMVKDNKSAWHAGKSKWKKFNNLNNNSIGIELVNKGHKLGYEKFTNMQIQSLIKLSLFLKKKYKIKKENFLGHSDIAPLRKKDPGEKFPWKKLSKFKIGLWYKNNKKNLSLRNEKKDRKFFFKNLHKIGYRYFKINSKNAKDKLLIEAFQRRFYPEKISGRLDEKTLKISELLAKSN
ncbi:MAG: N-acetylmuramoyl-L-alanine amidase [Pseudomonadota bacterium]|nr:N-acetylmuramoyl-L-alanine amidase [Pseudomonadota bacterium]